MNKKILMGLGATLAVVASIAAMSAYEAHVINVTAHIENALTVDTYEIKFGTVFPQEYVEEGFTISLSDSFMAAERVDDVEYVIKQKPKCINSAGEYAPVDYATHECPDGYEQMLLLCPYLSKLPVSREVGDVGVPSYYVESDPDYCDTERSLDHARGVLAKSDQDIFDEWIVDLKVPPVDGYVGQDWPADCPVVSQNDKDYGCDLWIEVTNISLPRDNGICELAPDVMQVLDRSGSIDAGELTILKAAANAFVTAMSPSLNGVHMGMVSFSNSATLDVHLTDNGGTVTTAINLLSSGGSTNLEDAIQTADTEFDNPGDNDDRTDADSPDFMVIITDGAPTTSNTGGDHSANAKAAADAAKANGITIYVVGIGTDSTTANYLKNDIASSPSHYFDASDWDQLQAILEGLVDCPV